jgi:hypothetical protein
MTSLLVARFFTTAQAQGSTTITVNTTSIVIDGNTGSVSALLANPGADGVISFTEALAAVNNTGAGYTINFDLPHGSLIAFNSSLDLFASNTTIDGDVGGNSTPVDVMLIYPADSVITLRIWSNNNVIRNLAIEGLEIFGTAAYSNTVVGSYIGTNVDGQLAIPRLGNGVRILNGAHHNIVENNIIAGNRSPVVNPPSGWSGVQIVAAHYNEVRGNRIGLNVDGDRLSNDFGVWIGNGASRNIIGGNRTSTACEGSCNVISGNNGPGIVIHGTGGTISNVVKGNYVGLSVTGLISIPNISQGIQVFAGARQNIIGGQRASAECTGPCNVISGNGQEGILLSTDVISSVVQGNFIG